MQIVLLFFLANSMSISGFVPKLSWVVFVLVHCTQTT